MTFQITCVSNSILLLLYMPFLTCGQRTAEDVCPYKSRTIHFAFCYKKAPHNLYDAVGFAYPTVYTNNRVYFLLFTFLFHFIQQYDIMFLLPLPAWQTRKGVMPSGNYRNFYSLHRGWCNRRSHQQMAGW